MPGRPKGQKKKKNFLEVNDLAMMSQVFQGSTLTLHHGLSRPLGRGNLNLREQLLQDVW